MFMPSITYFTSKGAEINTKPSILCGGFDSKYRKT